MDVSENGDLEKQASDRHRNFEWLIDNTNQGQVIGKNLDDRIREAVDSAVIVDKKRMHDATLTAMIDVFIPRVEGAVRLITGSSRNGPNSIVQDPDRKDFWGNNKNTPLMLASSQLDLNINQDKIAETHDIDNSEDGDFPAIKLTYDRRVHAHHNCLKFF